MFKSGFGEARCILQRRSVGLHVLPTKHYQKGTCQDIHRNILPLPRQQEIHLHPCKACFMLQNQNFHSMRKPSKPKTWDEICIGIENKNEILRIKNRENLIKTLNFTRLKHSTAVDSKERETQRIPVVDELKEEQVAFVFQPYRTKEEESIENIRIYEEDAINDFALSPKDLEGLTIKRLTSGWAKGAKQEFKKGYLYVEVRDRAIKKWGSVEGYKLASVKQKIRVKQENDARRGEDSVKEIGNFLTFGFRDKQGQVILVAVVVNGLVCCVKLWAYSVTLSPSSLAEFLHSLLDTANQMLIYFGLFTSRKAPDKDHPYGYTSFQNITSFCSGISFVIFGSLLSSLLNQYVYADIATTPCVSAVGMMYVTCALESVSLGFAIREIRRLSKDMQMGFFEYIRRGYQPNLTVVFFEDVAGVLGAFLASVGMTFSHQMGNKLFDSFCSSCISLLMFGFGTYLIRSNLIRLIGKSVPEEHRKEMQTFLERDRMIQYVSDVKALQIGSEVRLKAEVRFDGRELTQKLLASNQGDVIVDNLVKFDKREDLVNILKEFGDVFLKTQGEEIDRIERQMKNHFKKKKITVRHIDLEPL